MNFYKADENGYPIWFDTLPTKWNNISNFDKLPANELLSHGFYPVTAVIPSYDKMYQTLSGPVISIGESNVTATWEVVDVPFRTVKETALRKIRSETNEYIVTRYPTYTQINSLVAGRMSNEEITAMNTFIDACRTVCNDAEAVMEIAETGAELMAACEVTWPE